MLFLQTLLIKTKFFFVNNISQDINRTAAKIKRGVLHIKDSRIINMHNFKLCET